jgi:eukaryotic-like serine/threonine-protein kinase
MAADAAPGLTPLEPQALVGSLLPSGPRLERIIGAGAFAWVYLATTGDGTRLAVKVLAAPGPDARAMFAREAKIMRHLPRNPFCVRFVEEGALSDGTPFLVTEYVDGCTLKDAMRARPVWSPEEALGLMRQLCAALASLHDLGLAHRDVKPENVMLTRDQQVRLMDFGLVKDAQGLLKLFEAEEILKGRDFSENVDRALLAGTPEYMAPEQFTDPALTDESQARTDTWSDVYSAGVILYQLLTGEKLYPFKADETDTASYARSFIEYIQRRLAADERAIRRPPAVPEALWGQIARALRRDPKARPRHARDLGAVLARVAEGLEPDAMDEEGTVISDMGAVFGAGPGGDAPALPIDVARVQAQRDRELNTEQSIAASGSYLAFRRTGAPSSAVTVETGSPRVDAAPSARRTRGRLRTRVLLAAALLVPLALLGLFAALR